MSTPAGIDRLLDRHRNPAAGIRQRDVAGLVSNLRKVGDHIADGVGRVNQPAIGRGVNNGAGRKQNTIFQRFGDGSPGDGAPFVLNCLGFEHAAPLGAVRAGLQMAETYPKSTPFQADFL
jgi:hypothetical protein